MWFGYNPRIIFYHFFCKLNLVIFQALLLSTYVDSMYLVRVAPPMNFTFSGDSLFLKKRFLAGDINSLNLLVFFFNFHKNFNSLFTSILFSSLASWAP